jgi:hypothetical protein
MLDIYIFENKKRLNSTKNAPADEYGVHYEVVLKDNCDLLAPVFRLKSETQPTGNYLKFNDRYFWITNIISLANNLYEIITHEDCLTTFKHHISSTQAFVLYDSTPNTQLPDTRLAIETDVETHTSTASMPWGYTSGTTGTYFIATTGCEDYFDIDLKTVTPNKRNGTGVYAIPESSIKQLGFDMRDYIIAYDRMQQQAVQDAQDALDEIALSTVGHSLDENLQHFFTGLGELLIDVTTTYPTRLALLIAQNILGGGTALQNVKAVYWLPFTVPDSALQGTMNSPYELALGSYTDIVLGMKRVSEPIITSVGIPVTIPWQYTDWRNVSCTEIMLYIPLIGCINIPPEVVKGNDSLDIKFALNLYSGELAVEVLCDGAEIGTYGTNSAMNILIGDSNVNMGGAVNTIVSAVTKNHAGVASGVAETLAGMSTSVGGIGGGAGTGLTNQIVCICRCHETSQNPSVLLPVIGTPTRQLKTLSTSLGYCQCMNAQVNMSAVSGEPNPTQTEIEMINNYLNSGVYLE